MMGNWRRTLVALAAALTLLGSDPTLAGPHDGDEHPGQGHGHGRGGPHGDDGAAPDGQDGTCGEGEHGAKGDGGERGRGGGDDHGRGPGSGRGGGTCDPAAVAAILAAVDAACPCAGLDDGAGGTTPWRNHGKYVRCVVRALRAEVRAAGLKRRCVREVVPCAARSTCGKREAVACVVTTPGTCVGGTCADDPETLCMTDLDCAVRACRVTSPERCTAAGGVAASGSCCTASPSGAFLDAAAPF